MNTQANAMQSPSDSQVIPQSGMPAMRLLYWSVKRELWESRSIYIAPVAVAALFLVGFLISLRHLPGKLREAAEVHTLNQTLQRPYEMVALLIMGTTFVVALFYCLDALYAERRDRSILFWKSLPVSDLTTVLSKASIPLVVLPLVTFVVTIVTQWVMLLVSSTVLMGSGVSLAALWAHLPLVQMSVMLLYHLVGIHALWYAPIFGWLLLVSAWARRAAFLWATLPLLAIAFVEKIAFNTSHFANMIRFRLLGVPGNIGFTGGSMTMDSSTQLSPGQFLLSPGLWIGLIVAAAFLAAAVRLRRYREPI